LSWSNNRIKI